MIIYCNFAFVIHQQATVLDIWKKGMGMETCCPTISGKKIKNPWKESENHKVMQTTLINKKKMMMTYDSKKLLNNL